MQIFFVCDFFPCQKRSSEELKSGWNFLNVLLRGSDKKMKEKERSDIFLDGQVDQEEEGKLKNSQD